MKIKLYIIKSKKLSKHPFPVPSLYEIYFKESWGKKVFILQLSGHIPSG